MDLLTLWKIRNKYKNIIFPTLPNLLIKYLNQKHLNYLPLILSENIKLNSLIYFLRTKEIIDDLTLLEWTIKYIEYANGIFKKS